MKNVLMTMTLLVSLSLGMQAASQQHRHTPRDQQELVDSTSKDAVEVYSDTSSIDTAKSAKGTVTVTTHNTPWSSTSTSYEFEGDDVGSIIHHLFSSMDAKDLTGIILVLGVLFIIFVLAPVLIIIALFYFINKNRKQKLKLAQMAMQQGQPIPEQLLNEGKDSTLDDDYQKGMRQCFVGVGLMIFLGYAAGNVGFGIGALVFCIGLGKVFASRTAQRKNDKNDLIQNNYD